MNVGQWTGSESVCVCVFVAKLVYIYASVRVCASIRVSSVCDVCDLLFVPVLGAVRRVDR